MGQSNQTIRSITKSLRYRNITEERHYQYKQTIESVVASFSERMYIEYTVSVYVQRGREIRLNANGLMPNLQEYIMQRESCKQYYLPPNANV